VMKGSQWQWFTRHKLAKGKLDFVPVDRGMINP
jgi:hypothetical protein